MGFILWFRVGSTVQGHTKYPGIGKTIVTMLGTSDPCAGTGLWDQVPIRMPHSVPLRNFESTRKHSTHRKVVPVYVSSN